MGSRPGLGLRRGAVVGSQCVARGGLLPFRGGTTLPCLPSAVASAFSPFLFWSRDRRALREAEGCIITFLPLL